MATVGRTKSCTIVPDNHFGPIPGVPVGSLWKFRLQVRDCEYRWVSGVFEHSVLRACAFYVLEMCCSLWGVQTISFPYTHSAECSNAN